MKIRYFLFINLMSFSLLCGDDNEEEQVIVHYVKCNKDALQLYKNVLNKSLTYNNNEEKIITDVFLAREKVKYLWGLQWLAGIELQMKKFLGSTVYDIEKARIAKYDETEDLYRDVAKNHLAAMIGKNIESKKFPKELLAKYKRVDDISLYQRLLIFQSIYYGGLNIRTYQFLLDSSTAEKLTNYTTMDTQTKCKLYNPDSAITKNFDTPLRGILEERFKYHDKKTDKEIDELVVKHPHYLSIQLLHKQKPQNYNFDSLLDQDKQNFYHNFMERRLKNSVKLSKPLFSETLVLKDDWAKNLLGPLAQKLEKDKGLVGDCFKAVGL